MEKQGALAHEGRIGVASELFPAKARVGPVREISIDFKLR
jgi:hypothetical protein